VDAVRTRLHAVLGGFGRAAVGVPRGTMCGLRGRERWL